jgi:hypothetical protein
MEGIMRKRLFPLVLAICFAFPVFPDEETNRILNLLDDVLSAAAELENPIPPPKPNTPGFYLLNKTGFTLREVYIRLARAADWGPGVFNGYLYKGQTILVPYEFLPGDSARYHIRVIDVDGDIYSKYDIEITEYSTVEMNISDYGQ